MGLRVNRVESFYGNHGMVLKGIIDKELKTVDVDVDPYCFVHADDVKRLEKRGKVELVETDLRFKKRGGRAYKVMVKKTTDISDMRKLNEKRGVILYEADIPFVRRLMTDYDVIVDYDLNDVVFIDIEVDDSKGFPKKGINKILSVALCDMKGKTEWFYLNDFVDEVQMLIAVNNFLEKNKKSVLCAWNVNFDYEFLVERAKTLECGVEWLNNCDKFDLLSEYRAAVKGLESYSLSEVSEEEGFKRKVREKKVSEMNRKELEDYNIYDAVLCYEINKKYGFVDTRIELAKIANLTFEHITPLRLCDTLVLRRLRELGYVAEHYSKGGEIQGAYIKGTKSGLYENVFVADFESLYPNVIVNEKIDIEGFDGEVLPSILSSYLEKRKESKEKFKVTKELKWKSMSEALKIIMNSFYGALAHDNFRFADKTLAGKITAKGREMLHKMINLFENELGFEVIYCDTDSVFVRIVADVENKEKYANFVIEQVNEEIKPYKLKFEYLFSKILFPMSTTDEVKKRYVGMLANGEYVWRGLEMRRSDYPDFVKRCLNDVVDMIFAGKSRVEVMAYLSQLKKDLYAGKYNDKLVIVKSIRTNEKYKVKQPHVRAYEQALQKGWEVVDGKVKYVWIGNDVMAVLDENEVKNIRLNYDKYWEMIMEVVGRVLGIFEDTNQKSLEVL